VICYNGALIYDPPSKKVLAHYPIHLPLAKSVIDFSRDLSRDVLISVEVLDEWYTDRVNSTYQTETSKLFKPDKLAPIDTWLDCDVTKILLQGPDECLSQIKTKVFEEHSGKLAMAQSENNLLQIMAGNVSKGNALKLVCDHYGIPLRKTIAVGDAANDIDMIRSAGIGIAMADAPSKVKDVADYVTMKNDDDGVADALEKFVL
jgi:Cof subfamily protein (haloacid dehalogenase superfamily)